MKRTEPLSPALLVADIHKLCYPRFRRATRDDGIAADLCQMLWLKMAAYQARHGWQGDEQRLVHIAATNLIKDWWRRRRRLTEQPLPEGGGELADAATSSPEDALAKVEWQARVRRELVRALKSEKQQQLLLSDDKTSERLAECFGATPSAIRKCRERLIKRLRRNPRLRELWLESQAA